MATNITAFNFKFLSLIASAGNTMDRCVTDQLKIRTELINVGSNVMREKKRKKMSTNSAKKLITINVINYKSKGSFSCILAGQPQLRQAL
jgi:hypothetical protein